MTPSVSDRSHELFSVVCSIPYRDHNPWLCTRRILFKSGNPRAKKHDDDGRNGSFFRLGGFLDRFKHLQFFGVGFFEKDSDVSVFCEFCHLFFVSGHGQYTRVSNYCKLFFKEKIKWLLQATQVRVYVLLHFVRRPRDDVKGAKGRYFFFHLLLIDTLFSDGAFDLDPEKHSAFQDDGQIGPSSPTKVDESFRGDVSVPPRNARLNDSRVGARPHE